MPRYLIMKRDRVCLRAVKEDAPQSESRLVPAGKIWEMPDGMGSSGAYILPFEDIKVMIPAEYVQECDGFELLSGLRDAKPRPKRRKR